MMNHRVLEAFEKAAAKLPGAAIDRIRREVNWFELEINSAMENLPSEHVGKFPDPEGKFPTPDYSEAESNEKTAFGHVETILYFLGESLVRLRAEKSAVGLTSTSDLDQAIRALSNVRKIFGRLSQ